MEVRHPDPFINSPEAAAKKAAKELIKNLTKNIQSELDAEDTYADEPETSE